MEEELVQLTVMGLSYNQIHDGAYALMLAQVNGPYRIPVIIGTAEAQAIAVVLEQVRTPRPLTHDLFANVCSGFGIQLKMVWINSFEDGIFSAKLTFGDPLQTGTIDFDSRTSDAIAIAIRMGAPIYTTRSILEDTGFILEKKGPGTGKATGHSPGGFQVEIEWTEDGSNEIEKEILGENPFDFNNFSNEELEEMMKEAVADEDYETAAKINEILKNRNSDNTPKDSNDSPF